MCHGIFPTFVLRLKRRDGMEDGYVRNSLRFFFGTLVVIALYACANIANPNGGPYDETPPKYVSSTPLPNQLNYKKKKIEILFDELVQLDNPTENVIITPPQSLQATIQSRGKKVVVELADTLIDNTTYTIDFTSSISDNNESNPLENFTIAFSTGDSIDSLEVSGIILNASDLEPMSGITVGVHSNLDDSAFTKIPFVRTSRTNDRGMFTIRNMAPGTYRIYAVEDNMRVFRYSQRGQQIAFCDTLIVPSFEFASRQDTLWKDSLTIDTIQTINYTHFMPDNIMLHLFKEKADRQYMLRPERSNEKILVLRFNSALDTIPVPIPVDFTPVEEDWYFPQIAEEGTAAYYWLTDSTVWKQDTLRVEVTYPKSDSLNILRPQTDTVRYVVRRRPSEEKKKRRKKKDEEPEPIEFLGMDIKASGAIDIFDTIFVTFSEPVREISPDQFRMQQLIDSVWTPVDFTFFPDTTNSLRFCIKRIWQYGEAFHLEVDSSAITSVYGKWNNTFKGDFTIKREDEYGHLYINILGIDTTAFVELLNKNDSPVRKAKVKDGGALFMDLKPDSYYARLVVDTNDNGLWDTGIYADKLQPEQVFYCPKMFSIMQNWQVEETWNVRELPLERQKPLDITKNKPAEVTKKKRDYKSDT